MIRVVGGKYARCWFVVYIYLRMMTRSRWGGMSIVGRIFLDGLLSKPLIGVSRVGIFVVCIVGLNELRMSVYCIVEKGVEQ